MKTSVFRIIFIFTGLCTPFYGKDFEIVDLGTIESGAYNTVLEKAIPTRIELYTTTDELKKGRINNIHLTFIDVGTQIKLPLNKQSRIKLIEICNTFEKWSKKSASKNDSDFTKTITTLQISDPFFMIGTEGFIGARTYNVEFKLLVDKKNSTELAIILPKMTSRSNQFVSHQPSTLYLVAASVVSLKGILEESLIKEKTVAAIKKKNELEKEYKSIDQPIPSKKVIKDKEPQETAVPPNEINKSLIDASVNRYRSQIRGCYEAALTRNPKVKGKVVMRFTISPVGVVKTATVKESSAADRGLEQCIASRIRSWQFPKLEAKFDTEVSEYPFSFEPEN